MHPEQIAACVPFDDDGLLGSCVPSIIADSDAIHHGSVWADLASYVAGNRGADQASSVSDEQSAKNASCPSA